MRHRRQIVAALLLLAPSLALAYGVAVHDLLPRQALRALPSPGGPPVAHDTLSGLTDADVRRFRLWLYQRARRLSDTALRAAFLRRYPTAGAFDERAFREFLMMNASARVLGVDSFAAVYRTMAAKDRRLDPHPPYSPGQPIPLVTALSIGSIYPDLDRRNQSRLWREPTGAVVLTARGDTIPFDPMTLNMGGLTGLSSQAHGHYGLNRHAKSDDPRTLQREPWNFAIATALPGAIETYAPDNAQLYTDLSLLATLGGEPPWRTLSAFYAGNAMHYIADVANAVHTVQVGVYPIFVDATVQYWLRRAGSLFGLLGRTKSRNAIGLDILTNLHTLSEKLFQVELLEALSLKERGRLDAVRPSMGTSLQALETGDDSLEGVLADTLGSLARHAAVPDFARALSYVVVDATVRDGAEAYRLTRDIASSRLRVGAVTVDFDTVSADDVWRFVRVGRTARVRTDLDGFNAVHARGLARATTALRVWWTQYLAAVAMPPAPHAPLIEAIATRLVAERLRYLDQAEARRGVWIAAHGGLRSP